MPESRKESKRGLRVRGVLLRRKTVSYFLSEKFRAPCYRCGRRWWWKQYTETSFGPFGRSPERHYCCTRETYRSDLLK